MSRLTFDPPLPRAADDETFLQRIDLRDRRTLLGRVIWHAPFGTDGVVQLVELRVHPEHLRQGHAGRMLNESIEQARALHRLKRVPLRRIWSVITQQSQIVARSFLTKHGFHHTATISDLLLRQDSLIYVRSFD